MRRSAMRLVSVQAGSSSGSGSSIKAPGLGAAPPPLAAGFSVGLLPGPPPPHLTPESARGTLILARASIEQRGRERRARGAAAAASSPEGLAARLLEVIFAADALAARPPALPPLPPVNLGYAADNLTLQRSHRLTTSRACHRRTFDAKGLAHVSCLALQNCLDLVDIVHWNHRAGVRLFRVSSQLFPWSGEYQLQELPDYEAIAAALAAAGRCARAYGQRLTTHPPHFVKLASPDAELARLSAAWLEVHSAVFDLMGFPPSHWNKINIHVGGVYGSKAKALARFARAFEGLSAPCRARLTLENDDRPNSYSAADLLPLHAATGIPITFDLHHHAFCPGSMSRPEAMAAALATWPAGVRPVVHWSEPPECPERAKAHPHAHSAFVYGPIELHGHAAEVDVMIESKAKEVALLLYRDEIAPRLDAEARARAAADATAVGASALADTALRLVVAADAPLEMRQQVAL